jgi:hypothetical protein
VYVREKLNIFRDCFSKNNICFRIPFRLFLRLQPNGSRGIKQPGRKTDHTSPSSVEVNKGGAIPPFLHVFMAFSLINYTHGQIYLYRLGETEWDGEKLG